MTQAAQVVEIRKQGFTYYEISKALSISHNKIHKALQYAGLVEPRRVQRDGNLVNTAITYEDIKTLKAKVKVGTRIKVRTGKGFTGLDETGNARDPRKTRICTVTSVSNKRFLTVRYDSGVVEQFRWPDIVIMMRDGDCAIIKR